MLEDNKIGQLLSISRIYHEPKVMEYPRGREMLERFPDAERIQVASHQAIPELFGFEGAVEDWLWNKKNVLILGTKKALQARPNTRSSNWVAPSHSNGCSYCYVPRQKGYTALRFTCILFGNTVGLHRIHFFTERGVLRLWCVYGIGIKLFLDIVGRLTIASTCVNHYR